MDDYQRRYPKRERKIVDKEYSVELGSKARKSRQFSAKEKELLLTNLEKYGTQDINLLATKLGTKLPIHVYNYLNKHIEISSDENQYKKTDRLKKLAKWIEHMKSKKQKYPMPAPIALSMLMISLLEDHPVATPGEINFPEAYDYLFKIFSGRRTEGHLSDSVSAPTIKFIRHTVLTLMKTVTKNMDDFYSKLLQSAAERLDLEDNEQEKPTPPHMVEILLSDYFNPLNLNEQAIQIDKTINE